MSTSSSGSSQNDSCVNIPNKIMSMQLRLNHLWNQETYAMDLWENCNSIMKEFEGNLNHFGRIKDSYSI